MQLHAPEVVLARQGDEVRHRAGRVEDGQLDLDRAAAGVDVGRRRILRRHERVDRRQLGHNRRRRRPHRRHVARGVELAQVFGRPQPHGPVPVTQGRHQQRPRRRRVDGRQRIQGRGTRHIQTIALRQGQRLGQRRDRAGSLERGQSARGRGSHHLVVSLQPRQHFRNRTGGADLGQRVEHRRDHPLIGIPQQAGERRFRALLAQLAEGRGQRRAN